jgi:hypothetical protein
MFLSAPLAAATNGGGVHIQGNDTRVSVQRCVFTNNTAQWGAGLGIFGSSTGKPKLESEVIMHLYLLDVCDKSSDRPVGC